MLHHEWDLLSINTPLIKKLGLSCAAYLTVIIYESDAQEISPRITMNDFSKILGISKSMQTKHRKKLEELGLIKVKRMGLPATLHFCIDIECASNISKIIEP